MLKHCISKVFINSVFLIGSSFIANAQNAKDTSAAFRLIRNNELTLGVFGGQNYTFVRSVPASSGSLFDSPSANVGGGYDFNIIARLKFQEGLFLGAGFSYERQSYKLNQVCGSDSLPSSNAQSTTGNFYNNDQYTATLNSYYIGLPLIIGYSNIKNRWSYYFALGVEFYYNYKNEESMYDNTKGELLQQDIFYRGVANWEWVYSPFGLIRPNWSILGGFGILNAGISYRVNPKLSVEFEPIIKFSNPFTPIPGGVFFSDINGLANLSLNLGLTYSFQLEDIGSFKSIDKDNDSKRLILGFQVIPNYRSGLYYGDGDRFSFNYAFSIQFSLSNQFAFETGIVLDNVDWGFENTGVPLLLKYYFPHKPNNNSFYMGSGVHIDYSANIAFPFNNPYKYLLPIALLEGGYEVSIGDNYIFDIALGYEHELKYIELSDNLRPSAPFSQLPHIFYNSIGFSYKFK
jgi:outer membrane protein with beta-barrel domain